MINTSLDTEVAVQKETIKNLDDKIKDLVSQSNAVEKSTREIFDKSIARFGDLELQNNLQRSQIDSLLEYKKTSEERLNKLETSVSNYRIAVIVAIFVLTAVGGFTTFLLNSYKILIQGP